MTVILCLIAEILMKTGPTYTNVMDLQIAIIEKQYDPD